MLKPIIASQVVDTTKCPEIKWLGPDGGYRGGRLVRDSISGVWFGLDVLRPREVTIFLSEDDYQIVTEPHSEE